MVIYIDEYTDFNDDKDEYYELEHLTDDHRESPDLQTKMEHKDDSSSNHSRYDYLGVNKNNNVSSSFIVHKNHMRKKESDDSDLIDESMIKPLKGDDLLILEEDQSSDNLRKSNLKINTKYLKKNSAPKSDVLKLPPHPATKGNMTSTITNTDGGALYPSLLSGKSNLNTYTTPERKLKGIYSASPQANTANVNKQPFQIGNVKEAKFFKARKQSHSRKRLTEKESLYDEALKLKVQNNTLKEENTKLRTQVQVTEKEVEKRDQLVEDVIMSLNK